jgi:hypothetical protein
MRFSKRAREKINRLRKSSILREGEVALTLDPKGRFGMDENFRLTCLLTIKDPFGTYTMQRTFRVGKNTMVPKACQSNFLEHDGVVLADSIAADSILDAEILEVG